MHRRGSVAAQLGLVGCLVTGILVTSCTDAKSPMEPTISRTVETGSESNEPVVTQDNVPESTKNAGLEGSASISASGLGITANLLTVPGASFTTVGGNTYTVITVPFTPEAAPVGSSGPICDDCVMHGIPIGFSFSFYGNAYTTLNLSSNGFVQFGGSFVNSACCSGGLIPSNDFLNNIIAISWTDWYPPSVGSAGFRYQTRGTAPNRRFIVQWTNVAEFAGTGRLTAQLVLSEGSNDITMYVTTQSIQHSSHVVTQGIENSTGTEATFVSGRVRALYGLTNDAVRFTTHTNTAPSITPPPNLSVSTDAGVCTAAVAASALGTPTASDDAPGFSVGPAVRADGAALSDPYPHGNTTVVWTVTDAEGVSASASQTVTVTDGENPTITAPADVTVNTDPGQPTGTYVPGTATAADNCPGVTVAAPAAGSYPIGTTTLTWTATDGSGNSASDVQFFLVIDAENPVLTIPPSFTVNATMPGGAVVLFTASATDNSGSVTVECTPLSGSTYAIGTTSTSCVASDPYGNSTSGSFTVTVLGAHDQIENLIGVVTALSLHNGTSQPLLSMLATALRDPGAVAPDVACNKLGDFIIKLHDHKSVASISAANIAAMIADAERIQDVLGCP